MFKKYFIPVVTIFLATSIIAQAQTVSSFSDVPKEHQYNVAINFLTKSGVIQGYQDGSFKPENPITRAEILKVILKGSGIEESQEFMADFPDVKDSDWFAKYVTKAKELGIVSGNANDGTFTPHRQVILAEFLKMLLEANNLDTAALAQENLVNYLPQDDWYIQYINFAVKTGLLHVEEKIDPAHQMTRAEVVNMIYLYSLVSNGTNTQFLLTRAELELAQTEIFLGIKNTKLAKRSSTLAVDLTQKAYRNLPENKIVLGAAKIARAYDYLVDSFNYGLVNEQALAAEFANKAINKATEAWEANNATQSIAKHIKELAQSILDQIN